MVNLMLYGAVHFTIIYFYVGHIRCVLKTMCSKILYEIQLDAITRDIVKKTTTPFQC